MASSAAFEIVLQLKDEASRGLQNATKQGGFLKNALSFATGGAILGGITAIGSAAKDMFTDAIDEAKEWNTQLAQVEAVLTSTGGAAGLTKDEILEMNKALSAGGGFSAAADDAVLSGQNMLLTFTNIGEEVFPDATKAMLDMATKMNNGVTPSADQLKQTSIQLGKALNDPVKGVGALSRVGVTFTNQQKAVIEKMVATGDTMGAQRLILAELNKEFGGSATAAMGTFEGQQALVAEQFNNMKQTIGEALMPLLSGLMSFVSTTLMPIFQGAADTIANVVGWFTKMADGATSISQVLFNMAENVEGPLGPILGFFSSIVGNIETFIQTLQAGGDPIQAFFDLIGSNFEAIGGLWDRLGPMLGEFAGKILAWLGEQVPKLIEKLAEWGRAFIQWVADSLPGWLQAAGEFLGSVLQWLGDNLPKMLEKLAEWGGALIGWVLDSLPGWLQAAGEFIGAALKWIVEQIPVIVAKLAEWGMAFIEWIVPQIPGILAKLGEFLLAIGKWLIDDALPAIVKQLGEWAKAFLDWVGTSVLPFIGEKLGALWDAIVNWITTTAKDIWNKIQTIGTAIIDGIKEGITGAWDAFVNWVTGLLGGIVDGIKEFFGISSPSRLMAEQIGEPMVMGMQAGWDGAFPAMRSSMLGDMDGLGGALGERAAQIAQMMQNLQNTGSAVAGGGIGFTDTAGGASGGGSGTGAGGGIQILDRGGIVTGPRLAALAMDGRPEAVIPLDRWERSGMGRGGGLTINVTVAAPLLATTEERAADHIAEILYDRLKGRV